MTQFENGVVKAAQSHTVQKLQLISLQDPRFARHEAMQLGLVVQMLTMY